MGGEITWKCVGSGSQAGKYIFEMKLYRDCSGVPGPTTADLETNVPGLPTISLSLVSQVDNSPNCNSAGPTITCAGASGNTIGAVEEFVYRSGAITLNGVPPLTGWVFYFHSCCRNDDIINLVNASAGSLGFTLRAKMFPYNGQNANPCYDSSPKFFESPKTIICTGYPFTFNHNASDAELDSLVYDWAQPLDEPTGSFTTAPLIPFTNNYSYTSPLPGPAIDPNNVAATLDPNTGEVKYTSFTNGAFVMVTKVSAYKCGILVAEVYREIQSWLINCNPITPGVPNLPPSVTPPFTDPNSGLPTLYIDTVYAGDLVTFQLISADFDINSSFQFQNLSIEASGLEFDSLFTNSNGNCLFPPCATLSPPPQLSQGQQTITTNFSWQTDCNHLGNTAAGGCRTFGNVYNFVIKSVDDFCPVPGITVSTITIVVLPPPLALPPQIRCVNVQPNGDVALSWMPGVDSVGSFKYYDIYYSSNPAGPFFLLDSINNFATTSYTHVGAGGNVATGYYYMGVRSGCNNYLPGENLSDTVKSIMLDVTNPNNGYAHLEWNPTNDTLVATNHPHYRILKKYSSGGGWVFVDSVLATPSLMEYDDPITTCNDSISYRVEVIDSSGCVSVSSVDIELFQDIIPPVVPVIDSVSIGAGNNAFLTWNVNPSGDTRFYVIFRKIANAWVPIDTVTGINNNSLLTNVDASLQKESFRVIAIDSCGNPSAQGVTHNTVFLEGYLSVCDGEIRIFWNDYINWPGAIGYNLFVSENGGPFTLLASQTTTDFTHINLNQFSTYCYYIQAIDSTVASNARTSTSNQLCIYADIVQVPLFGYITTASVTGETQVTLNTYVDTAADVIRYDVYRSLNELGPYALIGSVPANYDTVVTYEDNTALVKENSYYYKFVAIDSCQAQAFETDIARTILLTANAQESITNLIEWNNYEVWSGGVNHYKVYRSIDGSNLDLIGTVSGNTNHYLDYVGDKLYSSGVFCYRVVANEGAGNVYGFAEKSNSNDVCVIQRPLVFIPNAITPSGTNPVFNPFKNFVDINTYSLEIYNRFGEKIFSTKDVTQGWDGTYNGKAVPEGAYVYMFKVTSTEGYAIEKNGTLSVIY